jgi:hypothetical protein
MRHGDGGSAVSKSATRAASAAASQSLADRRQGLELDEYRPGRNFIRTGDTVKCRPTVGRPFRAVIRHIYQYADEHIEVEVVGGPTGRPASFRTFTSDHIQRVAQSRVKG